MYIKSIVLEGFKSYGSRQEIHGFDPKFNAITGLNGSGKSNILDSICFVLGIQNLSQVRATSLTELVYKNGQAGINKATVSITFDNSDPKSSPVGYEQHKEFVVSRTVITGGKSKYMINTTNANSQRIHDLFQSVQLNVNNPHFLIMQGRITKVLNMKPEEILSMVEEAAGTRMYEDKKDICLKSLEKKESRLLDITHMLEEGIIPQLEKLKEERKEYTEYTKIMREHEQLSKICIAWDYVQTEKKVENSHSEKKGMEQKYQENKEQIICMKKKIEEIDKKIGEVEKQMDEECGNQLQQLEAALKEKQVSETRADIQMKNLKDALNEEKKKLADLQKSLKDEKTALAQKQKELLNSEKKLADLEAISQKDSAAIAAAENHFHAVNAGLSDENGEEASLAAQLIAAGKDKRDAETEAKSIEMSIKHMKAELSKKEADSKKVDKSYNQDQASYQKLDGEVKRFKAEIAKLNYQEGKYESLVLQQKKTISEIDRLKDELDAIFTRFPQIAFEYTDPVKNFDRKKVRGPVCLQIDIKDPKDCVALDVTAGGRLYNVIVDDEKIGKLLLDKGQLRRRCTIIPLNKIMSKPIDNRILQEAERLVGKENVSVAVSRVTFSAELTPAMQYVFGGTFISPSMEAAKKVTFAKNILKRSVTLDGEVFDPSGTLSGGSMGNKGKLLSSLAPVHGLKKILNEKQMQLDHLNGTIESLRKVKEKYDYLCEQCELKENEAQLLKSKIEQSNFHKQMEEVKNLQSSIMEQKEFLVSCNDKQKKSEKLIKELEVKTSKTTRENKVKEAEKIVSDCKKKAAVSLEKFNAFQADVNGLKLEIEGIEEGLPGYEEQMISTSKAIDECEKKLQESEDNRKIIKESVATLSSEVKKQKAVLKSHSGDINKMSKEKDSMIKEIANIELQLQQLEHDIKNCGEKSTDASKKLKYLCEKNKWIQSQKEHFGAPKSEFDFQNFDPRTSIPRLKELEEAKEKLGKNVNQKAQSMLNSVEVSFNNLTAKKERVLVDKAAIAASIKELDEQKKNCLREACKQVNKDFGSIFRTLLPGSDAMLIAPSGKTVLDGLEFRIAFGNVWKESLNELSGGQRSLVALSLILALLLFNPAPIYILDEVDAALDLSHTQNIGKMLKMHFTTSQFIIVSLKDGMFNNANVLFRTKFVDGMSTVIRTTNKNN